MKKNNKYKLLSGAALIIALSFGWYVFSPTPKDQGALGYSEQDTRILWGKNSGAMASTTVSFACATSTPESLINQNVVLVKVDKVENSTGFEFYFEHSDNSTDWFRDVIGTVGSASTTLRAMTHTFNPITTAPTYINVPKPMGSAYLRMCVRETGVSSVFGGFSARTQASRNN